MQMKSDVRYWGLKSVKVGRPPGSNPRRSSLLRHPPLPHFFRFWIFHRQTGDYIIIGHVLFVVGRRGRLLPVVVYYYRLSFAVEWKKKKKKKKKRKVRRCYFSASLFCFSLLQLPISGIRWWKRQAAAACLYIQQLISIRCSAIFINVLYSIEWLMLWSPSSNPNRPCTIHRVCIFLIDSCLDSIKSNWTRNLRVFFFNISIFNKIENLIKYQIIVSLNFPYHTLV